MNDFDMQFHTAVFGGFQKQDVLAYLESNNEENGRKTANLQRELSDLRETCSTTEQERDQALAKVSGLESANNQLASELEKRDNALEELQRQLAQVTVERDSLKKERNHLSQRVEELRPLAAGYEAIKDRTAGIELEAHGRAQIVENEAKEKVVRLQNEMDKWCAQLRGAYSELHKDAEASLARAAEEMEQVSRGMESLKNTYVEQEKILDQLRESVEQITGPKVPEPIPAEET